MRNRLSIVLLLAMGTGYLAQGPAAMAEEATSSEAPTSDSNALRIYGRLDLSVDTVKADAKSNVGYGSAGNRLAQMADNTSRLGFTGAEDLGSGSQALFSLEFGINTQNGSLVSPPFRNSYVGLRGSWGTFNMGRLDSSVPTGSPLYSQIARNTRWIVHDAGVVAIGTRVLNGSNRVSNAITYQTPSFGGFNVVGRLYLAGPDGTTTSTNPALKAPSDFRQHQIALNYQNGPLGLGAGYGWDEKKGGFLTNDFINKTQAVASYDVGTLKTYGVLSQEKFNGISTTRSSVNVWLVGATAPFGANRVTVNYMARSVQTDRAGTLKKLQAEYSYSLSKRSMLYVFLYRDVTNSNVPDSTATGLGVGIQHRF